MSVDTDAARMKRKADEKELGKLQIELCYLQEWVKSNKLRVIVLFEGRDAAGKGGTIKAITEKVKLASTVIERAVRNGMSEVQVYRFPNSLCTDKGRAINKQEPGWENTLTGIPREIFQLWADYLKPRGYRISYQIIDFPEGLPGDIAITIAWGN